METYSPGGGTSGNRRDFFKKLWGGGSSSSSRRGPVPPGKPSTHGRTRRGFLKFSAKAATVLGFGGAVVATDHRLLRERMVGLFLSLFQDPETFEQKLYHAGDQVLYGVALHPVPFTEIPPHLWQALVVIEDKRFFQRHASLDREGTVRGAMQRRGGSTLPMQLAEMLLPSGRGKVRQKRAEWRLGQTLLQDLGYEGVIEQYLNTYRMIIDGDVQVIGLAALATRLFNKPYQDLTLEESVMLGCMFKSPAKINRRNPSVRSQTIARRLACGKLMYNQGYIDEETYTATFTKTHYHEVFDAMPGFRSLSAMRHDNIDPRVMKQVREEEQVRGLETQKQIEVTIDPALQTFAEQTLYDMILPMRFRTVSDIDGYVLVINQKGEILADVPSFDYAINAHHTTREGALQTGSTIKPIALALWAQHGYVDPQGTFDDLPSTHFHDFAPKNRTSEKHPDGYYQGAGTTFRQGVQASSNVMMPWCLSEIEAKGGNGVDLLHTYVQEKIGKKRQRDASITLGSGDLSPLQLAQLYGPLLNQGKGLPSPHYIKSYGSQTGEKIPIEEKPGGKVLDESIVAQINTLTRVDPVKRGNHYGTWCKKTGTTEDEKNGRTIYYHPENGTFIVCGIYAPTGEIGGYSSQVVAPLGHRLLEHLGVQGVPPPPVQKADAGGDDLGIDFDEIGGDVTDSLSPPHNPPDTLIDVDAL